jgi:hypothetical protein
VTLQEIEASLRREPELPTVVEALARAVMRFVQARRLKRLNGTQSEPW